MATAAGEIMFDAFISHAWEDKEEFVRPLAVTLAAFGMDVWYDEFTLKLGDSLSKSLDSGLVQSRFGVIVLSKSFFQKNWTDYELRSLLSREVSGGGKVIITILHGLTPKELVSFSPYLADKISLQSDANIVRVACSLIEVIRPDLFEKIMRRVAYLEMMKATQVQTIETSKILISPHQHKKLPINLVTRVRLIRAALLEVYPHSMDFWVDGFRRDSHPSREIRIWEHIAACYIEFTSAHDLTAEQRLNSYNAITSLSMSGGVDSAVPYCKNLPTGALDNLALMWRSDLPIYDIEGDDFERVTGGEVAKSIISRDIAGMKEHFPHDVPDELIAELISKDEDDSDNSVSTATSTPKGDSSNLTDMPKAALVQGGDVNQLPRLASQGRARASLALLLIVASSAVGVCYWMWL
jgi:TIR domain